MYIDPGLTILSQQEIAHLYENKISAADAYAYLTGNIRIRTFSETLRHFYQGSDIKERLTAGLCRIDALSHESASRKVRDWLNDQYAPGDRNDLIKICFILGFDEAKAGNFLSMVSEGSFHMRDPLELTFAYGLRSGKSYMETLSLYRKLEPGLPKENHKDCLALTKGIADSFQSVYSEEELIAFFEQYAGDLGELHNTAYTRFSYFLGLLINPTLSYAKDETAFSLEAVAEQYLRMKLPLDKNTAKFTVLQKTIRKYWPNTTLLTKMNNREEDVTRKILLLLYLVTEGGVTVNGEDAYLLDEDFTDEERFEDHFWRLNSMLNDCGFSRLDPRNVFDWLVLYGLRSDEDTAMGERIESVLSIIFGTATT